MATDIKRAVERLRYAGEGWRQMAILVGAVSVIAGGVIGYAMSVECTTGVFGGCSASDKSFIFAAVGAVLGVLPALPLAALSQLYRHLADIEGARVEAT